MDALPAECACVQLLLRGVAMLVRKRLCRVLRVAQAYGGFAGPRSVRRAMRMGVVPIAEDPGAEGAAQQDVAFEDDE
jgi:hypothetical protein